MAICIRCNRRIGLAKHGYFRRHMRVKGELCKGSWEWPYTQEDRIFLERQRAQHPLHSDGGTLPSKKAESTPEKLSDKAAGSQPPLVS